MTSKSTSGSHAGLYPPSGDSGRDEFCRGMADRLDRMAANFEQAESPNHVGTIRELRDMAHECRVYGGIE